MFVRLVLSKDELEGIDSRRLVDLHPTISSDAHGLVDYHVPAFQHTEGLFGYDDPGAEAAHAASEFAPWIARRYAKRMAEIRSEQPEMHEAIVVLSRAFSELHETVGLTADPRVPHIAAVIDALSLAALRSADEGKDELLETIASTVKASMKEAYREWSYPGPVTLQALARKLASRLRLLNDENVGAVNARTGECGRLTRGEVVRYVLTPEVRSFVVRKGLRGDDGAIADAIYAAMPIGKSRRIDRDRTLVDEPFDVPPRAAVAAAFRGIGVQRSKANDAVKALRPRDVGKK